MPVLRRFAPKRPSLCPQEPLDALPRGPRIGAAQPVLRLQHLRVLFHPSDGDAAGGTQHQSPPLGLGLLYAGIAAAQGYVQANYGIFLPLAAPSAYEWSLLGGILLAALLIGCVPAWRAYRQSLADGLSIRI